MLPGTPQPNRARSVSSGSDDSVPAEPNHERVIHGAERIKCGARIVANLTEHVDADISNLQQLAERLADIRTNANTGPFTRPLNDSAWRGQSKR